MQSKYFPIRGAEDLLKEYSIKAVRHWIQGINSKRGGSELLSLKSEINLSLFKLPTAGDYPGCKKLLRSLSSCARLLFGLNKVIMVY